MLKKCFKNYDYTFLGTAFSVYPPKYAVNVFPITKVY